MKNAASRVRWVVLAFLVSFAMITYLQRINISVAAVMMMPGLGLNEVQMGRIFSTFLLGYAIFQIPAGAIGDRIGSRLTLGIAALIWGATTFLTGVIPRSTVQGFNYVIVSLCVVRFLLGAGEAATFPVSTSAVRKWMPGPQHAFGNSLIFIGSSMGAAVATPLVSWLMWKIGWRGSFYATSLLAFLIAPLWLWYARDTPGQHSKVNAAELTLICGGSPGPASTISPPTTAGNLFADKNVVLLLLSYVSEGYVLFVFVFWLYIYFVQVRGFSILKGGVIAALPWLTAAVMAPMGGIFCDRLSARKGRLRGARITIMLGYTLSGVLLFVAAYAPSRTVAVVGLCLSIGFLKASEASFWTAAAHLAGERAGTLGGAMNTAGVLGGILSTSLMPILVLHFGWFVALSSGTAMALLCPLLWLMIGTGTPTVPSLAHSERIGS